MISNGAHDNIVGGTGTEEGNIISGNRGSPFPFGGGVEILGTGSDHNRVIGNFIGADYFGVRALRNGSAGVIIGDGARYNVIGGTTAAEGNLIAGNRSSSFLPAVGAGIHLFGSGTSHNEILGNRIGVTADGTGKLPNRGHGIALVDGASDNRVGGDIPEAGNLIANNEGDGIYISGRLTSGNLIRYNRFHDNDSLGILIVDSAQEGTAPPLLQSASPLVVAGSGQPSGAVVDIFRAAPDPSGAGEGLEYLASGTVAPNGEFSIFLTSVLAGDTLTAQLTDSNGNSSAFSANIVVQAITGVDDDPSGLPLAFELKQNYPNPFNPVTTISFTVPVRTRVRLDVLNALGEIVATPLNMIIPSGEHSLVWTGRDITGHPVASGVYFYRLTTADRSI
ncbi:MAG: hypothetical protein D6800_03700, partial [Candidatus Zixiibacteriota bacterium]